MVLYYVPTKSSMLFLSQNFGFILLGKHILIPNNVVTTHDNYNMTTKYDYIYMKIMSKNVYQTIILIIHYNIFIKINLLI